MSKVLMVTLLVALCSGGAASAAPVPKPHEGVIVITSPNKKMPMEIVNPNGTSVKVITSAEWFEPWQASLSPDGSRVAYLNMIEMMPGSAKQLEKQSICYRDLDAKEGTPPKIIADVAYSPQVLWAANGKSLYYSLKTRNIITPSQTREIEYENWIYDLATEKRTRLRIPKEHSILAVSPDGKNLITHIQETRSFSFYIFITPLKTLMPESFAGHMVTGMVDPKFSPDSKRVVFGRIHIDSSASAKITVKFFIVDLETKNETRVKIPSGLDQRGISSICWSPDGKRFAYHWVANVPGLNGMIEHASRVTVCNTDGSESKVIVKREPGEAISGLDWR